MNTKIVLVMFMMKMEIKFNKEKANELGISVDSCYEVIEKYLAKSGIYRSGEGIYFAEASKGFKPFGDLRYYLPDTDWFMKIVEKWYWFDDIDNYKDPENYNCLRSYEKWGN